MVMSYPPMFGVTVRVAALESAPPYPSLTEQATVYVPTDDGAFHDTVSPLPLIEPPVAFQE